MTTIVLLACCRSLFVKLVSPQSDDDVEAIDLLFIGVTMFESVWWSTRTAGS